MNKLTDENCREQFEEWFSDHAGQTVAWVKSQRASDTHYKIGPEIQRYWLTWQASRQALEIALPILEQQDHEKSIIAGQLEAVRDSLSLTPHQDAIISCAIDRLNVLTSRTLELSRSLIKQQEQEQEQEQDNDGWIDWGGGRCPVDSDCVVGIRYRDGEEDAGVAGYQSWRHCEEDDDIIAYRIIPEKQDK